MELKDRIKAAREYAKLTRGTFAQRCGVEYETVRQWENGQIVQLRPESYQKIVDVTGVRKPWLMTGDGPMVPEPESQDRMTVEEIADAIRRLPIPERLRVIAKAAQDVQAAQAALRNGGGDAESPE